jgi:hypothetical protein
MLDVEHWETIDCSGLRASPIVRQHASYHPIYIVIAVGERDIKGYKKGRFLCGDIAIFRIGY